MSLELAMPRMSTYGIIISLLMGMGCAKPNPRQSQESTKKAEPQKAGPSQGPLDPSIQNRKDKLSYAFGVDMARTIQRQKDALNVELLRKALSDTLAGSKLTMSDDEVTSTLKTFEVQLKQDLEHARSMVAARNRKQSETFFAENAKKEGVVTLPSGLQYKVLKKGSGKLPKAEDVVVCNYRGALLDGTEIDSSYKRKEPTTVPVKGVIAGFAQALQLMPVGSKWQLSIPPQLAYGERATPGFGPNSTLVFDVELLSIKDKAAIAAK
jgi:FKBP-type peptidyl-prolyl cis-trans isomerase FklB